jgi:hypothetical protein
LRGRAGRQDLDAGLAGEDHKAILGRLTGHVELAHLFIGHGRGHGHDGRPGEHG